MEPKQKKELMDSIAEIVTNKCHLAMESSEEKLDAMYPNPEDASIETILDYMRIDEFVIELGQSHGIDPFEIYQYLAVSYVILTSKE